MPVSAPLRSEIPASIERRASSILRQDESLRAAAPVDLSSDLKFSQSWLVLTDQQLLHLVGPELEPERTWSLAELAGLKIEERGAIAVLDILGPQNLLYRYYVTTACLKEIEHLVKTFDRRNEPPVSVETSLCPTCHQPIPPDATECPKCTLSSDSDTPAPQPGLSMLRLLRFARPWWGMILLGLALTILATGAGLVPPYLTMPMLDKVLIPFQTGEPVNKSLVVWYLAGLLGASVLAWLLGWGKTYVLAWVSERISAELRNRTFAHLQRLSLSFFSGHRTGDLIARVSTDTDRICYFLSVNLIDFTSDVLMIILTAGILVSIDPLLALITLAPLPLIAWLVHMARENLRGGFAAGTRVWGELTSHLADAIPGIRVVKAFAQEQHEIERFRVANDRVLAANDRVNRTWSFFGPMIVLLTDIGLLVVWACGAWGVFAGKITVGVLTAFVAYITRFYSRLESMSRMLAAVQRAAASAHRVFEVMDMTPDVPTARNPVRVGRLQGEIELRGVSFRYGNRQVIKNVNLKIAPGEMVGFVGPSGAGKSTLVNLVCRFYDVTDGGIFVDGINLKDIDVEAYRKNIGLVLQESFLFYGTISENIAYGRPDATREEIISAAKAARAHDFILRLPDGYDSLVGERGQQLSGGERQRISIARALLIDPALLILDEATSAVDTETERDIQLALENLIRGRTTIAIAHRLSTLQKASRLVVLENGQVTEIGPHEDLLQRGGTYRRLHEAQMAMASGDFGTLQKPLHFLE